MVIGGAVAFARGQVNRVVRDVHHGEVLDGDVFQIMGWDKMVQAWRSWRAKCNGHSLDCIRALLDLTLATDLLIFIENGNADGSQPR